MSDIGKIYGCGVAVIVAIVPLVPLAFVLGWSGAHCEPKPICERSAESNIGLMFVGLLLFAAATGYGWRKLLNRMAAAREDGGYSAAFSGIAGMLSLIVAATALALLYTAASV